MAPACLTPIEQFRRPLDAAVAAARAAVVAGLVGRVAAAAAAAIVALAAVDLLLQWNGFWPGGSVVATVVGVLAWRLLRSLRGSWPSRLRIARAAEAGRPDLGERLSRAVDFLDTPRQCGHDGRPSAAPQAADAPVTRALESLAVEQAAATLREGVRLPVPGAVRELAWAAAGLAAVAAVWCSAAVKPRPWGACVARQLVPATASRRPPAGAGMTAGPSRTAAAPAAAALAIPAATATAWRRIESMLRLSVAAAGRPDAAATVASLQGLLARTVADSRAALAAAPSDSGAAVLQRVASTLVDLERDLATSAAPPAERLDTVRRSLESLVALARASAGIADAAVFQARLAAILADRFQRHPGLRRGDLPSPTVSELDRLASLQAECLADVDADVRTVRAGAGEHLTDLRDAAPDGPLAEGTAADAVAVGDRSTIASDAFDIADNRLAIAAATAVRRAAALERIAEWLGMPATRRQDGPPPAASRTLRAVAELDRLQPAETRDAGGDAGIADSDVVRDGADRADGADSPGDRSASARHPSAAGDFTNAARPPRPGSQAGSDGGTPAADAGMPGAGGRASGRPATVAEAGRRQERIWNLLPPRERPSGVRAADVPVAAAYRAAVDDYFRAILHDRSPPEAGRPAEVTP